MRLFEKTLKKEYKYKGKILNLRVDDALLEDETTAKREVVEHVGGVCVLAEIEGKIYFVRQFRYPYKKVVLELPAGKLDVGENPIFAGTRELLEETGITAEKLIFCGELYPSPGYTDEVIYLYIAKGLKKGESTPDEGEFLSVEAIDKDEVKKMILSGEIKDAKTLVLLLKYFGEGLCRK